MAEIIQPYYQDDSVTIYNADCRDVLPTLDKGDLLFADPPYGNGTDYASYDDTEESLQELIEEAIVPAIGVIAPVTLITPGVANMWRYPAPKWTLCFASGAGTGSGPWGFTSWQPVLAYGTDPFLSQGLGRRPDTKLTSEPGSKDGGIHPCPKPHLLMKWIVARGTTGADQTVLDPFMGSGTTLRAAKDLGRKSIGIELEEKYCEIAAKRMSQMVMELAL